MSDTEMDTPAASHTTKVTSKSNKPDVYYGDRNKLENWLLQVDVYFHLEGDKVDDMTWLSGPPRFYEETLENGPRQSSVATWTTTSRMTTTSS